VVDLDAVPSRGEAAAGTPPAPALSADNLAYVMYTSGSTGRPKGVGIPHRAVLRLVSEPNFVALGGAGGRPEADRLGADDLVLCAAPLGFDAATLEIWMPFAHGARLLVAPEGVFDSAELGRLMAERGVTWAWLTSGLFHQMMETVPECLAGVRQVLTGGDVVSVPHARKVLDELPGVVMTAAYGPTENTVFTTACVMRSAADLPQTVPLGRPISDSRAYVLDRRLNPLPPGAVGEIFAAGDGLARGYLGRPARTAVSFLPDPFCGEEGIPAGARMYATGDLGRWLPDGRLMFGGRRDQQVKIRGYRIEPGEVEAVLAAHPGVAQAVVLVLGETSEDKRLAAFAVPAPGAALDAAELGEMLRRRLPPYMVPATTQVVDAMPRTARDKVDRKALAELASQASRGGDDYVAPRNEIEEVLVNVWSELIGAPRIGVRDNFFDLGGHSLHATRHMFRIRELLEIDLPVRALYEAPTIEQLAQRVEERLIEELEGMSDAEVEGLV
jgi:amino acid adenylation domain-containing protein